MRFLFTCIPMFGHLHAMVPYARALRARGHEVVVATGANFGGAVQRAGLEHHGAGIDHDASGDVFSLLPEWPGIVARFPDPGVAQVHGFVEALAPRMLADVWPLVSRWRPDVVVRDPLELGGYLAAERAGIPHATVCWAIPIPVQQIAGAALAALWAQQGLPGEPTLLDRFLLLSALPPSWPYPGCPTAHVLHRFQVPPFDASGDEGLPAWARRQDRPLVHVTLGTTFNQAPHTFQALLAALDGEDLDAIVTVGRSADPDRLGPVPGNVRVARYIPQTLLLPSCDALVFHGGFNSLHAALWHGLPMVMVPLAGGDQIWNARMCQELGAGVVVEGQPPDPDAVRRAVRKILHDPAPRAAARALQAEMRALPELDAAADLLERLGTGAGPSA
jgi:UDP:flavonoid glycosyltransferase YjiC (YdhE family)